MAKSERERVAADSAAAQASLAALDAMIEDMRQRRLAAAGSVCGREDEG